MGQSVAYILSPSLGLLVGIGIEVIRVECNALGEDCRSDVNICEGGSTRRHVANE